MNGLRYDKLEQAAYLSSPLFNTVSIKLLLALKGLSTLKWTYSGFKDHGLLILPLTLIFHFGETPENGRDSGQNMSNPVSKSY